MPRIVTYECTQCGTEVVVTADGRTNLMPIYCCGIEVAEVSTGGRPVPMNKKGARKPAKKSVRTASSTAAKTKKKAGSRKKTAKIKRTAPAKKTAKRG